ncbi:hypothetical protein B0A56_03950 [Flavobacterium columnare NBRC 100251 = ATCC 23463]|nr:hypothetical protein B0A56_03950 [Flavobacterium columnare NBRC 100251 = ATCC 23463]
MRKIRESRFSKIVAYYLLINLIVELMAPTAAYALTTGPTQPEFNSFTPIATSDMVDLSSGDFNYNIPIMDVGGYPINLAYNSGVTMDQEASWVGLGWDLSVGQISRQVRGLPDDFKGDVMTYENNMKPNITIGSSANIFISPFGLKEKAGLRVGFGLGIKYNNYDGVGFSTNGGISYDISKNLSVGLNLNSSSTEGVSVLPSASFSLKTKTVEEKSKSVGLSLGIGLNSRKGVETFTASASYTKTDKEAQRSVKNQDGSITEGNKAQGQTGSVGGGSLSFANTSFTPTKRIGMSSKNYTFSMNIEIATYGINPGTKFSGYKNEQGIKESEKNKTEKGFGYENTTLAGYSDILDFNREKDRELNENTISLPITNYSYDLYNIQGQGIRGMFRPYRGQVGLVYDNYTTDESFGLNLGGEIGAGSGAHFGFDIDATESISSSGLWQTSPIKRLLEKKSGNNPNYEKVFFKNIGGFHVDKDMKQLFYNSTLSDPNNQTKLGGYSPVAFKIEGAKYNRNASLFYYDKFLYKTLPLGKELQIKRGDHRVNRGQSIEKISVEEARKYGEFSINPFARSKKHHTAAIRITKEGGERYNYDKTAYNVVKKEVTFDISGRTPETKNKRGFINYVPGIDNSTGNNRIGDQYFNRITTPGYAHTYLLTSVLSSDYRDIDGKKGPTDGDLGNYTKFSYENKGKLDGKLYTYKWRVPYEKALANYDEGLKSLDKDNKGNYLYGEKEMVYLQKIETKTHVAIFSISARKDGHGVMDENGGRDDNPNHPWSKMWKLDKIALYSKPEYSAKGENAIPIKVANFVYDYSLCQDVPNNNKVSANEPNEIENQGGKLTLKKIYFTYRNSNMGKHTPYIFNYGYNPKYDQRANDVWGNYKPEEASRYSPYDPLSNAEYPYVEQRSQQNADLYTSAWLLNSVELPSGGILDIKYESDDYKYVQDKEVMQMFKVVGVGSKSNPSASEINSRELYTPDFVNLKNYLYIRLDKVCTLEEFQEKYIKKLIDKDIYFRFLLNMNNVRFGQDKYDYVTGYINIESSGHNTVRIGDVSYGVLKIKTVTKGDGLTAALPVNPIAKAGWFFGRQHLNKLIYNNTGEEDRQLDDVKGVVMDLMMLVPQIADIFKSPNAQLIEKGIAMYFIPNKSWIRLMQPDGRKFGGGARVKEIKLKDRWDVMTEHKNEEAYMQAYGQEYIYKDQKGNSSGVATYEPIGCKENPLVLPFYDHAHKETLLGGDVKNYVEMPLGECFYPSPKITYARVAVKNLTREKKISDSEKIVVKKHATGQVVSEFYTSREYPTIADFTKISPEWDHSDIGTLLNLDVKTHLSLSQGFFVHTNDMDGKLKSQKVYAEGQDTPISGMDYIYDNLTEKVSGQGNLNNEITTIDENGKVEKNIVGVDYDVINDFRINQSETQNIGIHFNTEMLPVIVPIFVPIPLPIYSHHENILKTAVTTKVVHSTGILRETIAYDLGSQVSTRNLAWDANTGEVILTETINEFNDKYYSFNFPAYWAYKRMNQASLNLGLEWDLQFDPFRKKYELTGGEIASNYLVEGDEVWVTPASPKEVKNKEFRAWVVNINTINNKSTFDLIDEKGVKVSDKISDDNSNLKVVDQGKFKVIRSGYANMASASMQSVTLMKNPLENLVKDPVTNQTSLGTNPFLSKNWNDYKIVNVSAIEYNDIWPAQCNGNMPRMTFDANNQLVFQYNQDNSNLDFDILEEKSYNPYRYNILGIYRPIKSYAYLTGRNNKDHHPRHSGFLNDFKSFYIYDPGTNTWKISTEGYKSWTFASEISQFNPWGQEIENKDALNRYSTALYGYNNRFPIAVGSNTRYKELAFDGFEDYDFNESTNPIKSHFNWQEALRQERITITDKQAHTGKKSIRVEAQTKATVTKKLINCNGPAVPKSTK